MNDEYLWDKSGEPDPEIQQLEEILGPLRYQPKPLELPEDIKPIRRNRYLPLLAIAATLLIALLAGVVWLKIKTGVEPRQHHAIGSPSPVPSVVKTPEGPSIVESPATAEPRQEVIANNNRRRNRSSLSKTERKQAIEAKEQLIVALRLASEKLNLVQQKTQGPAAPGQIRNQHKVG